MPVLCSHIQHVFRLTELANHWTCIGCCCSICFSGFESVLVKLSIHSCCWVYYNLNVRPLLHPLLPAVSSDLCHSAHPLLLSAHTFQFEAWDLNLDLHYLSVKWRSWQAGQSIPASNFVVGSCSRPCPACNTYSVFSDKLKVNSTPDTPPLCNYSSYRRFIQSSVSCMQHRWLVYGLILNPRPQKSKPYYYSCVVGSCSCWCPAGNAVRECMWATCGTPDGRCGQSKLAVHVLHAAQVVSSGVSLTKNLDFPKLYNYVAGSCSCPHSACRHMQRA